MLKPDSPPPKERSPAKRNTSLRASPERDRSGGLNNTFILTGVSENNREKSSPTQLDISTVGVENQHWTELKVPGKNIAKRCYHTSVVFDNKLYVYGGYELNTGRMSDFQYVKINEDFNLSAWQPVKITSDMHPGALCRHTGLLWQSKWYIFGGQISSIENTKKLWVFDFLKSAWKLYWPRGKEQVWPNSVHSHSCNYYADGDSVDEMVISFGFIGDNIADHSNQVWSFNFQKETWTNLFPHTPKVTSNIPEPRSGQSTAIVKSTLYVFGGADNDQRLNDMWGFDLKYCEWQRIQLNGKIMPEPRFGHTMNVYKDKTIILFGGFQDIAHERDDLMAFDTETSSWEIIEMESIAGKVPEKTRYGEFESMSPASIRKKSKSPTRSNRRSPTQHARQLSLGIPKKSQGDTTYSFVMNESMSKGEALSPTVQQKQARKMKQFLLTKRTLLDKFEVVDPKLIQHFKRPSPTTQTMKHSLEAITAKVGFAGKNQANDVDLLPKGGTIITPKLVETIKRLPTVKDGKVHGRRAGARDGHSATIYKGQLLIFGGDRHKMSYNDVFIFDLDRFFQR